MTEQEMFAALEKEARAMQERHVRFPLVLDGLSALMMLSNLQLALRCAGNVGRPARLAREIIDTLTKRFDEDGYPAHAELARRGDDPANDL